MTIEIDDHTAFALLEWQIEMGADEAIGDTPINRYEVVEKSPAPAPQQAAAPATPSTAQNASDVSKQLAAQASDLTSLRGAIDAFELSDLKAGARSLVFADGIPDADVMIVGEAPGRDEDREGKPFVGRAGQLLDKMLSAINLSRNDAANPVYITNVLPWRPPQNRTPTPDEIAMFLPFLERHIQLIQPKLLVLMGNTPCSALLRKSGITRLRGHWAEYEGIAVMPTFHPAYLLRNPIAKREVWSDLLSIRAKLNDLKTETAP